ncbi:twin-arginine translocase TatA/TatE family subunit [Compostimonas suwonensis]|uniref:Sec-independent protein translocase protein TatB n=1 Tax=Compostimonas suwonensis TaxID=1048394 RepID=A0A2M9C4J6_9MICO|nr:twin-arginine translocase TatA/TatE family subunit [Compostimonas suwonensis]PJJ65432.1 sec-independent protein translocase protein TatB [Compostimonas suwonensis]
MFGLTFEKLLIIAVIAALVIGPHRLPGLAARAAQMLRRLRSTADSAMGRVREELGPDFDDVDWKKLDPRQYDPRRIVRNALMDDTPSATPTTPRPEHPRPDNATTGRERGDPPETIDRDDRLSPAR